MVWALYHLRILSIRPSQAQKEGSGQGRRLRGGLSEFVPPDWCSTGVCRAGRRDGGGQPANSSPYERRRESSERPLLGHNLTEPLKTNELPRNVQGNSSAPGPARCQPSCRSGGPNEMDGHRQALFGQAEVGQDEGKLLGDFIPPGGASRPAAVSRAHVGLQQQRIVIRL